MRDILQAAIRVLTQRGARHFTTIAVAQAAGVSVGSLYQYFPNKESILFRLQADEWDATWQGMHDRLFAAGAPFDRLTNAVRFFFSTEADEAELRVALDDASALLREAPEATVMRKKAFDDFAAFLAEVAPGSTPRQRAFTAEFVLISLWAIAEKSTERRPGAAQLETWAAATAQMLEGFISRTCQLPPGSSRPSRT